MNDDFQRWEVQNQRSNPLWDAMQFLGNALDTPGSVARGLLAGEGQRALAGIFYPHQRVSGREMLENWGAVGENQDGLDLGDVAGFGAELLTDPTNLAGGMAFLKNPGGAINLAKSLWDETPRALGITPDLGVFPTRIIREHGGDKYKIMSDAIASNHYGKLFDQAAPEELAALSAFSDGGQARISAALRGSNRAGDSLASVWPDPGNKYAASTVKGMPPIWNAQDALNEFVPYVDSLLSRGETPFDTAVFRKASKIGGMDYGNAEDFIGRVVADPSYLSTNISPWGSFVNTMGTGGENMRLVMMLPKGSKGAYYGGKVGERKFINPGGFAWDPSTLHAWADSEHEFLVPRSAQF